MKFSPDRPFPFFDEDDCGADDGDGSEAAAVGRDLVTGADRAPETASSASGSRP